MIKKIIITLLVFNLLFLTAGCSGNMNKTALTINSNKISVEEFIFAANICKSETILYFTSKYNASDVSNDEFWQTEFSNDGEKPIDILKEKSIEYLKKSYAVFSLSKNADIISDVSFKNIKDMYNKENSNRENQNLDGIVYGVTSFDFNDYYDWLLSTSRSQLENMEEANITDNEIEVYYEKNKDKIAAKPIEYECLQYEIGYSEDKLDKINIILRKENDFNKIGIEIDSEITEVTYSMVNEKAISVQTPNLLTKLKKSNVGDVFTAVDSNSIYIVKLENKSETQYEKITAVSSKIKSIIAKEKINEKIENIILNTEIQRTEWLNNCKWQDLKAKD